MKAILNVTETSPGVFTITSSDNRIEIRDWSAPGYRPEPVPDCEKVESAIRLKKEGFEDYSILKILANDA